MHRCSNNTHSCLQVRASLASESLNVSACRAGAALSVGASRIGSGLRVTAGIVCTVNRDAYLRVVPDVVWLDSSTVGGEFEVYSNVVWRIE